MEDKPIYQKCVDCCIRRMIEYRAYEIWEYRQFMGEEGSAETDWYLAEREIMGKLADRDL